MVFEKVCEIVAEQMGVATSQVGMDTCLKNDLGADSLNMLDIFMELEDLFDVDLPDKKLGTVVGEYVRYIQAQVGETGQETEKRKSA